MTSVSRSTLVGIPPANSSSITAATFSQRMRPPASPPARARRSVFHPSTLEDTSSPLLQRVSVEPLSLPPSHGAQVCAMKLRKGSEATMYNDAQPVGTTSLAHTGQALTEFTSVHTEKNEDMLVQLNRAILVSVIPTDNGWYAEIAIQEDDAHAVGAFCNTVKTRIEEESSTTLAFVSPLRESSRCERDNGVAAKLLVKLSEYQGLLLSSTFCDVWGTEASKRMYGPGDDILSLYSSPPVGPCIPTVHFMGYWYDKTKCGPLIYLSTTSQIDDPDLLKQLQGSKNFVAKHIEYEHQLSIMATKRRSASNVKKGDCDEEKTLMNKSIVIREHEEGNLTPEFVRVVSPQSRRPPISSEQNAPAKASEDPSTDYKNKKKDALIGASGDLDPTEKLASGLSSRVRRSLAFDVDKTEVDLNEIEASTKDDQKEIAEAYFSSDLNASFSLAAQDSFTTSACQEESDLF
mmetsp:Transcript_25453/g.54109  ORF Transcript_25453/g.54109 Transcript_25453/m.54109 type:complete len:462 (+) Transcript_25453:29-1414(+)